MSSRNLQIDKITKRFSEKMHDLADLRRHIELDERETIVDFINEIDQYFENEDKKGTLDDLFRNSDKIIRFRLTDFVEEND